MELLPKGTYIARAVSAGLTESATKKTPQVEVVFEIGEAEHAGQRISWYGFLTDKTTERTLESLRYAGWRGSDLSDLSDLERDQVPNVELVVEHEEYEGKTRARVQWVNRVGGRGGAPLPAEKAKAISAKIRGALAQVDQKLKGNGYQAGGEKPPI